MMQWMRIMLLWIATGEAYAGTLPSMVTVGTDDMRPWVDRDAPHFGIIARIVSRAFELAQLQTQLEWIPWKRLFHRVYSRTFDAVFPMGYSDERAAIFLYSDDLLQLDRIACHHKSKPFRWTRP